MKLTNRKSLFAMLLALALTVSNTGCGGASSAPPPPPPAEPADITGQWSIFVEGLPGFPGVFANISSQGGGDFFATGANTMACDLTTVQCQITNTPNVIIQISQSNRVTATISNVINLSTGTSDSISADGTVDSTGFGMSGTWVSHGGLEGGTWQAKKTFTLVGGPYFGSMNSTVSPASIPVGVSLSFAVDASSNLTASAAFTNSACFTTLSFTGHEVGGAFYMTDSTSSIVVGGIVIVNPFGAEAGIFYRVLFG